LAALSETQKMTDFLFVLTGVLFFAGAWLFTKACDRL
jgi:hypothetical protein